MKIRKEVDSMTASKLVELNLVDKVEQLKAQKMSMPQIQKIINEKYLPDGEQPMSLMVFYRYFNSKLAKIAPTDLSREIAEAQNEVDPYDEMKGLSETMEVRIEKLAEQIQSLETDNRKHNEANPDQKIDLALDDGYRQAIKLLEQLVGRKEALLNNIASYQAQIGTFENMRRAIKIMVDVLKSIPGAFETFSKQIESNVDIKNLCK